MEKYITGVHGGHINYTNCEHFMEDTESDNGDEQSITYNSNADEELSFATTLEADKDEAFEEVAEHIEKFSKLMERINHLENVTIQKITFEVK